MAVLFAATLFTAEAQTNNTVKATTYGTTYAYTFNTQDEEIIQMSPGQLLERAGTLKNTAIAVALVSGAVSAAITVPTACGLVEPRIGYAVGGVVALVGGIASLAIEIRSNKLIKEAGRRMACIELKANGVTVKF